MESIPTNVRGMEIDGAALQGAGITALTVDAQAVTLQSGPITIGATDGKTPEQYGPLNQVFHRPFCFVWPGRPTVAMRTGSCPSGR